MECWNSARCQPRRLRPLQPATLPKELWGQPSQEGCFSGPRSCVSFPCSGRRCRQTAPLARRPGPPRVRCRSSCRSMVFRRVSPSPKRYQAKAGGRLWEPSQGGGTSLAAPCPLGLWPAPLLGSRLSILIYIMASALGVWGRGGWGTWGVRCGPHRWYLTQALETTLRNSLASLGPLAWRKIQGQVLAYP